MGAAVSAKLFFALDGFAFEGIGAVLPIRYASRIMPHILKAMFDELVIDDNTRCTTGIGAVDDNFPVRIECL